MPRVKRRLREIGNHPSGVSSFVSSTMSPWGWEETLDWFKPLRLGSYPRRGSRVEKNGKELHTTTPWFFPGRTSVTYLVMLALCNCSFSHWSTILFCNTNDTHGVLIHSLYSIEFSLLPHLCHPHPLSYARPHHYWKLYHLQNLHFNDPHTLSTTSYPSGPLTLEFPFQQFFSSVGATNTLVLTTFRQPSFSFVASFPSLSWNPVAYHYNHFPASTLSPSSYPLLWPTIPAPEQTSMASQASLPQIFSPLNDTINH